MSTGSLNKRYLFGTSCLTTKQQIVQGKHVTAYNLEAHQISIRNICLFLRSENWFCEHRIGWWIRNVAASLGKKEFFPLVIEWSYRVAAAVPFGPDRGGD